MSAGYPNNPEWRALREGTGPVPACGGRECALSVVECGELVMRSGRLVACDPFVFLEREGNEAIDVGPGRYRVAVTLADVSDARDGSHVREAYASLILADRPEAERRGVAPHEAGEAPEELGPGELAAFAVDAGTACFVDDDAVARFMPEEDTWHDELFESEDPGCWFARMDDPDHIREGLANIVLPGADDGSNIVIVHSGWGDGVYPVVGGYDADGNLVAVHIDFAVVGASGDEGDEDDEE